MRYWAAFATGDGLVWFITLGCLWIAPEPNCDHFLAIYVLKKTAHQDDYTRL